MIRFVLERALEVAFGSGPIAMLPVQFGAAQVEVRVAGIRCYLSFNARDPLVQVAVRERRFRAGHDGDSEHRDDLQPAARSTRTRVGETARHRFSVFADATFAYAESLFAFVALAR